jgi:tRNA nucleotidyltransferase (CCA-adding enzyme)
VRDLLLAREIRDVDMVVEGDAVDFARRLAALVGGVARAHERFGTASLALPDGLELDVAASRRERYARPGALPEVTAGAPIEEDLARRDFTINALAVWLGARPRLVDPFGGREDLEQGVVRALHSRSFLDDPTRAFRAVRYGNRLGFRLAPATRRDLVAALTAGALDRISADRLRRELRLVFEEAARAGALRRMETLGLDAAVHPALRRRPGALARLGRAEAAAGRLAAATTWLCYLLAWMGEASVEEVRGVARRLGVSGAQGRALLGWPQAVARFPAGLASRARSEVRRAARNLSADEIVAAAAVLGPSDGRALLASTFASTAARLSIRGADLRAAGVPAGPAIGRALERTLAALEDGRIAPSEELAFALRAAREEGP